MTADVRVRHAGHKWPRAYTEGTATVEAWEPDGKKGVAERLGLT